MTIMNVRKSFPALTVAALLLILISAGIASCRKSENPTPLPRAYPRATLYPAEYVTAEVGVPPLAVQINSRATLSAHNAEGRTEKGSEWFDIVYPDYLGGTEVNCTLLTLADADALAGVIDNRTERMALNTGGNRSEITSLSTPAGWEASVVTTPSGCVTPVQFMAFRGNRFLGGAYTMPDLGNAPSDSVAPYIKAVEADIIHLIETLP